MAFVISVEKMPRPLQTDLCSLGMEVIVGKLSALTVQPMIMEATKGGQLTGPLMEKFKQKAQEERRSNFFISEDGVLGYKGGRIYVPNEEEIKKHILCEAHNTPYAMHSGTTKMYKRLEETFLVAKDEEGRG